ncbi:MAG: 4Fe-4S dicluster domain-containing protein, partial [Deltaproteobacteria bacterium]
PEAEFQRRCTGPAGCRACAEACPHGAIGPYPATSRHHAGTPALDPNTAPCHLCPDLPCARACEAGALVPIPTDALFFGLARVLPDRCFVFQGPECGACAPACPIGALRMVAGRPVIDADTCNGCGLCRAACPVWNKAITIDL